MDYINLICFINKDQKNDNIVGYEKLLTDFNMILLKHK